MTPNKAKCLECETVLHSRHRHDFVTCECGSLSLDGGDEYQRVLWKPGKAFKFWEEGDDW